ncbi:hypothetical protein [Acidipropionibacterium acidipropionici]|uniref:hypothetical protein n=1 Tax=Acidipropionibacterium acidipropionici TaxID=1748 RepID=UPI0004911DE2|nr:hypothetical protein [Acidipropionibacterium acidipropionici]ALN14469.1 hypothetical protein ASQ49_03355 [Acidipropionibacterium acidipropionici]APZ09774.1 hypothetical protein BWX38_11580 [Acidipropionibacterium acidipropionici]
MQYTLIDGLQKLLSKALSVLAAWLLVRIIDHGGFRDLALSVGWSRGLMGSLIALIVGLVVSGIAILAGDGIGLLSNTGFGESFHEQSVTLLILSIVLSIVFAAIYAVGMNTLWFGYLLRSLSGRPVIGVVVVSLVPALVSLLPAPTSRFDPSILALMAQSTPEAVGVGLASAVMVLALRSVWPSVGIAVGARLISLVSPGAMTSPSAATAVSQSAITGALFAVAALVTALLMGRHRWQQVAHVGPFATT